MSSESGIKRRDFRHGSHPDSIPKHRRKKNKKLYKFQLLEPRCRQFWFMGSKTKQGGCWNLFPCSELTWGFYWYTWNKYEKIRDAEKAIGNIGWGNYPKYIAWKITKNGKTILGGFKQ